MIVYNFVPLYGCQMLKVFSLPLNYKKILYVFNCNLQKSSTHEFVTNLKNMKKGEHKVLLLIDKGKNKTKMDSHTWDHKGKKLQKSKGYWLKNKTLEVTNKKSFILFKNPPFCINYNDVSSETIINWYNIQQTQNQTIGIIGHKFEPTCFVNKW